MKYLFVFLLLILGSIQSVASPKIAVITAIEPLGPIEQNFQTRFEGSGYELKFIRRATAIKVRNELLDKNNAAVFFIGHANSGGVSHKNQAGYKATNAVLDYYGNNIADVFSTAHSNLSFLGLIGCNADAILKSYKSRGLLPANLTTFSFKGKVYPNDHFLDLRNTGAVTKAIDAGVPVLSVLTPYAELFPLSDPCREAHSNSAGAGFDEIAACQRKMELKKQIRVPENIKIRSTDPTAHEESISLIARRTVSREKHRYSPAKLSVNDIALFIFPETSGSATQEFVISIPKSLFEREDFQRLELQSLAFGAGYSDSLSEQNFEFIKLDDESFWSAIKGRTGRPLGDKTQIYLKHTAGSGQSPISTSSVL